MSRLNPWVPGSRFARPGMTEWFGAVVVVSAPAEIRTRRSGPPERHSAPAFRARASRAPASRPEIIFTKRLRLFLFCSISPPSLPHGGRPATVRRRGSDVSERDEPAGLRGHMIHQPQGSGASMSNALNPHAAGQPPGGRKSRPDRGSRRPTPTGTREAPRSHKTPAAERRMRGTTRVPCPPVLGMPHERTRIGGHSRTSGAPFHRPPLRINSRTAISPAFTETASAP
jgi:hypothetical protein